MTSFVFVIAILATRYLGLSSPQADTVRLVVPSLTMDERALLDEQLAERDAAVVALREQLAEAAEREAEAAELAAQLAWREAQVRKKYGHLYRITVQIPSYYIACYMIHRCYLKG